MKKILIIGVISLSALLSGCTSNHYTDTQHASNWDTNYYDHTKMINDYYFNKMDTNGDGMISKKEFMNYQHTMFHTADTNHDGYLSKDELMAYMMQQRDMMKEWKRTHADSNDNEFQPNTMGYSPQ